MSAQFNAPGCEDVMERTRLFPFAVGWYALTLAVAVVLAWNWEPAIRHVEAILKYQWQAPTAEIEPEEGSTKAVLKASSTN